MSLTAATLVFFAGVVALFLLPLLPAWREIRLRVDARALPIASDGRVSTSYFAGRFRNVLRERLAGPVQEVKSSRAILRGHIDGGEAFVVLPAEHPTLAPEGEDELDAMVLAVGDLEIASDQSILREVYVEGSLRGGDDLVLRATLCEGDVELGKNFTSLRWLHSGGDLHTGTGAELHGRASARGRMRLEPETEFERLHAERIEFGEAIEGPDLTAVERGELRFEDLPEGSERAGGRTVVHEDLDLPAAARWTGDLVVRGRLDVGDGAEIHGSVRARSVQLGRDTRIWGSVTCEGELLARENVTIEGLLLAEGHVDLAAGCCIGSEPGSATLRARSLDVTSGCVVHGTVWVETEGGRLWS